jgi:hypothetical protein
LSTPDTYRLSQRVNWSSLKELRRSPAHYRQRMQEPRSDTPAMRLGRAVHLAVLEPQRFEASIAIWFAEFGQRRGASWREFQAKHAGCEILTESERDLCREIQQAVRADREAARLLTGGRAEMAIEWTDPASGIECKGRLDYVSASAIVDVKTTRTASPTAFGRESWRLRYHGQLAFYRDGWAAAHGGPPLPCYMIAVEKEPPFAVQTYRLSPDLLEAGREEYADLLARLAECRARDEWPGYTEGGEVIDLLPPSWAMSGDDDEDVSDLGLDFSEEVAP